MIFGTQNLATFVLAGVALNIVPGPDTMYIIGRSVSQGRRAGVLSVMGISTGVLLHTTGAALGLSSIFAVSALAFDMVRYAGAAYLIYLGLQAILQKAPSTPAANGLLDQMNDWSIYRQGLLTNLLNPKVALFFLAFLPQFVDPEAGLGVVPFFFLGGLFTSTGTLWCLFIAFFSASVTRALRKSERFSMALGRVTGMLFVGLGLHLLWSER
jgi:RhtB (resistance to homoserine/threonine) family protein